MKIFDFMHAYQPFFKDSIPDWVIKNLEEVFLPLSRALVHGYCKHTIQIQGWTLDAWNENERTKPLFGEFVRNIRQAMLNGNVDIAFSAYSHPILPLLSNTLIEMQIEEDYKTVLKFFGEPKVFFPPEGAIDERTLRIISDIFPDITIMIPDRCISEDTVSGFYRYHNNKLAVFSVIIKDALMGAPYFQKPPAFVPHEVDWNNARKAFRDDKALLTFFEQMDIDPAIIARDMENGESRNALQEFGPRIKEIPALADAKAEKLFIKDGEITGEIESIGPASWEPLSHETDPFPFWAPRGEYFMFLSEAQKNLINTWLSLVHLYDIAIQENKKLFKETSPCIISCFPWHFTTPLEWDNNIGFSEYILDHCIKKELPNIFTSGEDKEKFEKFVKVLDENLKELQKKKKRLMEEAEKKNS
ncbi:MAG: hypothetical protein ACOC32_03400 [Nanoarchaeota archaeon]